MFFLGAAGDVNPYHADTKPTALALSKSMELGKKLAAEVLARISEIQTYRSHGHFSYSNIPYSLPTINQPEPQVAPAEVNTLLLTQDIALASFSGEFFNQFGLELKRQSPSKHTFFLGYTNGAMGYTPTREAAEFGGYGADNKDLWFEVGTGERQVADALDSLKTLYQEAQVQNLQLR